MCICTQIVQKFVVMVVQRFDLIVVQRFHPETWIFVPCTVYSVHTQRDGTLIRSECFVQRDYIGQDLYLTMCTSTQRLLWIEVSELMKVKVKVAFFYFELRLSVVCDLLRRTVQLCRSWNVNLDVCIRAGEDGGGDREGEQAERPPWWDLPSSSSAPWSYLCPVSASKSWGGNYSL